MSDGHYKNIHKITAFTTASRRYAHKLTNHGLFPKGATRGGEPTKLSVDEFPAFLQFLGNESDYSDNFRFRRLGHLLKSDATFSARWLKGHPFVQQWAKEYLHSNSDKPLLNSADIFGEYFFQLAINGQQPNLDHSVALLEKAMAFNHFPALQRLSQLYIAVQRFDLAIQLVEDKVDEYGQEGKQLLVDTFEGIATLASHPQHKQYCHYQALLALHKNEHPAGQVQAKEQEYLKRGLVTEIDIAAIRKEARPQAPFHPRPTI